MLTPLVVSSSYSFLRGVPSPAELASAARRAGLPRLALTDRNGMHGLPTFSDACAREGILPLGGVEFAAAEGRAVVIARTREGFSFLTRTLTRMAAPGKSVAVSSAAAGERPVFPLPDLLAPAARESCGDVFILTDEPGTLVALRGAENLFALATPCNRGRWEELAAAGIKPVASPELRFLDAGQRELQRLLFAIERKTFLGSIADEELDPESSIGMVPGDSWAVPAKMEPWREAAFANNTFIAENALAELFSGIHFPRYRGDILSGAAARGASASCASSPEAEEAGPETSRAYLRILVREGALRRYGAFDGAVAERADYELSLIESKGFCDYFLVVRDIVRKASRVCGRGSAAASIVSYCLGITEVDPLRHNLYFDRFLNPGRKDPPDIDVDFAWDERDAILDALVSAYGADSVARVANHNCFREKSSLRETARAFGMADEEIGSFEKALRVDKAKALAEADRDWKRIVDMSLALPGMPRHLGAHSGGIVIVPGAIADYAPVEETGTGIRVISWDKEGAETAGLVKIDLLGNRSLAVVRDAIANIGANGEAFDAEQWRPIDDPSTVSMLSRGDTMGVFYVESPAMRLLQKKTGRGDFDHLVIHSSIIRPAANKYINEYIDRLHGKPWKPLHPLLVGLFDESFGILCYQEDVSKAAIALAGFSSTEADGIRKILSKKDADTRLQEYWPAFLEGARARIAAAGGDGGEDIVRSVWDMIRSFSGYSFVKAHSASYAMLSFQSAYLRAHYPAEFMAAVMSNHGGFYSTLAYSSESRRMGLCLLSPDVNRSGWRCDGRGRDIRFGFCMVASLSESVARALLEERRRAGPFVSVEDVARRLSFERGDAEALVGSGALDGILGGARRSSALMTLLSVYAAREGGVDAASELFPEPAFASADPGRAAAGSSPARPRRAAELRYLGTTLDSHPLELWPRAFSQPRQHACALHDHVGRRVRLLGWPVTAKPVLTSSEEPMEFVSFEDETAIFEAVLFPDAFRKYRHLLFEERPLWITGIVEHDRGADTLTIENLVPA